MKLVWLSHIVPFPPRGGNLQRSFNLIREISPSFEVVLVAFNLQGYNRAALGDHIHELEKYCASVQVWDPPYPWRSARWWAELCRSPFVRYPHSCRSFWSPQLAGRWEATLQEHPGALLHFDSLDLALFVDDAEGFRKALNHHNCESAMAFRRAHEEANPLKKSFHWLQGRKLARLECNLCPRFEVNIAVSDLDAAVLRQRNPRAHLHIVENGTDTSYFLPGEESEEPRSLIFAGSLDWYPNRSGIQFFARQVWPILKRECPGVRLYLAGRNPPGSLLRWAERDPGVVIVPNPVDIRPWMVRAAVFICPILDGGGTRLKILDAMAMSRPVVSTTIGCEGLRVRHNENILIADAPSDFAHAILRAFASEPLRKQLGTAGRRLVERYYSWERIANQLRGAYRCALGDGDCRQGEKSAD